MDYRRTSLAINPQQKIHKNSHIYVGFAGAGATLNNAGSLAGTMWWDEERIEATVTRQYVLSKLRPDEQQRLDEPLGFGDGLTDDTYMEWIEEKAKRIFLILVDLGVPDQIFGVVDDSWDDDDLPIPLDQVERLQLTYNKDEKLERKFFQRQFSYLLRNIQRGDLVFYDDVEVIPLELADKRPVTGLIQSNVDKVHLPGRPDDVFLRRRIPLGITPGHMPQEEFLSALESMKAIEHDHLMSLWASYIHQDCGHVLLTPINDSTLKSFLTVTPQSVKILPKQDRRILLMNWLHCLAIALSFLHSKGLAHRNIRPSNVMLDLDNHIFLGDSGVFTTFTFTGEKKGFDKESYDYASPEQWERPASSAPGLLGPPKARSSVLNSASNKSKRPGSSNGSVFSSVNSHSNSSNYASSTYTTSTSSHPNNSPPSPNVPNPNPNPNTTTTNGGLSKCDPQKSDIFSLGTIFLEILAFLLKRASRNFASHRSSRNKTPGRGGGLPDSSFHKNLGQVESWMNILMKDARKKEDGIFKGVGDVVMLIQRMMNVDPDERPTAQQVQERLYIILTDICKLETLHCKQHVLDTNQWNFGFDQLRLATKNETMSVEYGSRTANGNGIANGNSYGIVHSGPGQTDAMSIGTKTSKSSEGKSKVGSSSKDAVKAKPKAKAWQAPVYAELSFG